MISILLILYISRVAIGFYRVLKDPLPSPLEVIVLSTFFYNAPLAIISLFGWDWIFPEYKVFLTDNAADPIIAERTIIICFVSVIALEIGKRIFVKFKIPQKYFIVNESMSLTSMSYLIGIVAFISAMAYSMGFNNYFSGYDIDTNVLNISDYIAFIYFSIEASGIIMILFYANKNFMSKAFVRVFIGIFVSFILVMAISRGKRLEIVVALLPLLLLLWSMKLRRLIPRATAVALFLISFSALASLRYGEIPTASSLAFNSVSEGLYAGHMTPGVISAVDYEGLNFEEGARFAIGFIAVIPRAIFPQKDQLVYQSITDITEFTPLGATTMLAEVYLQAGLLSIIIFFMLCGFVSRMLETSELIDNKNGLFPLKSIYYLIFVGTFIFHFRDGIIVSMKLSIQMIILVLSFRLFLSSKTIFINRSKATG